MSSSLRTSSSGPSQCVSRLVCAVVLRAATRDCPSSKLTVLLLPASVHERRSRVPLGGYVSISVECLCWHAFERSRYCFILGFIWNTTNRAILDVSGHTRLPARHDDHQPPARGQSASSQVRQSASSQGTIISSQPEEPRAGAVGAPGPAPPPPGEQWRGRRSSSVRARVHR